MEKKALIPFSTKTSKRMALRSPSRLLIHVLTERYRIDGATDMEYLDREIRRQIY